MPRPTRFLRHLALAAVSAGALAGPVSAQSWDYTGFFYLWGSSTEGKTVTGEKFTVSFSDLLESLDFGLNGALEARNGPWSLFGDVLWLKVSDDGPPPAPGAPVVEAFKVQGFVLTAGAGYDVIADPRSRLAVFGGLRHANLDMDLNVSDAGTPVMLTSSFSNWDAIAGVRGTQQLGDRWSLAYYADIGTGESDLTWQLSAAIDYQINNWALSFGYRHTAWEISNLPNLSDLSFSGPFFGAKVRF